MIIHNIRGTNGAGKTTAVKKIMRELSDEFDAVWVPGYVVGTRKPSYEVLNSVYSQTAIAIVVGHYANNFAGCDGIKSVRNAVTLMKHLIEDYPTAQLICEGQLLSADVIWITQLLELPGVRRITAYCLNLDVDMCLASLRERLDEAGNADKPIRPEKVISRYGEVQRAKPRLKAAGVDVRECSRQQVIDSIVESILYPSVKENHENCKMRTR